MIVKEEFWLINIEEGVGNNIVLLFFSWKRALLKLVFQIQGVTSMFRNRSFSSIQLTVIIYIAALKSSIFFRMTAFLDLGILRTQAGGNLWHLNLPAWKIWKPLSRYAKSTNDGADLPESPHWLHDFLNINCFLCISFNPHNNSVRLVFILHLK